MVEHAVDLFFQLHFQAVIPLPGMTEPSTERITDGFSLGASRSAMSIIRG